MFLVQFQNTFGSKSDHLLKVLQINIWLEGTSVENGFEAIVNIILQTDADLVTISEVENYNNGDFIERLCDSLLVKGKKYYGRKSFDSGLISRFPITDQQVIYNWNGDHGSITKAIISLRGKEVVLYSVHLDYLHYGPYLPRGYDGYTWKRLPERVSSPLRVIQFSDSSKRIQEIETLIADAAAEVKKGSLVFIGGDFNEPSHLDWVSSTRDLYDHNGLVIPWNCTKKLDNAGFIDAYRKKYPDPFTHPGFTYPSDNPNAPVNKLAWAPLADDRDRIDFIFYAGNSMLNLKEVYIVGPRESIVHATRIKESSEDRFITPDNGWPSDHKGVIAIFDLQF
jgi:endonuclease/exonuclease/phosphatase family metal-dependent hydrolase